MLLFIALLTYHTKVGASGRLRSASFNFITVNVLPFTPRSRWRLVERLLVLEVPLRYEQRVPQHKFHRLNFLGWIPQPHE